MFTMTQAAYFEAEDYFVVYIRELGEWLPAADPQTIVRVPVKRYSSKAAFEAVHFSEAD